MYSFNHFNFNVRDIEKSLAFYKDALGLSEVKEYNDAEGSFRLVFLGDGKSPFSLELTWLRDHPEAYDLGEQEYHLAFVADDYEASYKKHSEMDLIVYENKDRGIYFLEDPDGYWIEILPQR